MEPHIQRMVQNIKLLFRKVAGLQRIRKSTQILYFLLAFIVGVAGGLSEKYQLDHVFWLVLFCVGFSVIIYYKKYKYNRVILPFLFGSVFLFIGWWRVEVSIPDISQNHISASNATILSFKARIIAEPDIREQRIHYTLAVPEREGYVLLFNSTYPQYKYGDIIAVTCRLEQPEYIEDFNYPRFLAKDNIYSLCYKPASISLIVRSQPTVFAQIIQLKHKFKTIIDRSVPYPASTFVNSIVLGLKREVPTQIQDQFALTGTSHIMAISGMHIVVLSHIVFYFFRTIRVPKKFAFIGLVVFLIFFLLIIGFKASAIRAGIFGLVGVVASVVGRPKRGILILLWAAVLLLLFNPLLLFYDVGFQLSFLAVLGLLYTSTPLKRYCKFIPQKFGIQDALIMTLAAQVFVLPLLMYTFGNVSLISPVVNVFVIPLIPIVMLMGIMVITIGLVSLVVANIVGTILWFVVSYILIVVELFSKLSFASLSISLTKPGMLVIYSLLILLYNRPLREYLLSCSKQYINSKKQTNTQEQEIIREIIEL